MISWTVVQFSLQLRKKSLLTHLSWPSTTQLSFQKQHSQLSCPAFWIDLAKCTELCIALVH